LLNSLVQVLKHSEQRKISVDRDELPLVDASDLDGVTRQTARDANALLTEQGEDRRLLFSNR
jgi:hypothetical protein